ARRGGAAAEGGRQALPGPGARQGGQRVAGADAQQDRGGAPWRRGALGCSAAGRGTRGGASGQARRPELARVGRRGSSSGVASPGQGRAHGEGRSMPSVVMNARVSQWSDQRTTAPCLTSCTPATLIAIWAPG